MKKSINYYEILGVRRDASDKEITIAYRARSMQYHPDKYAHTDEETLLWATEKMKEINMAYAVLSNPEKRKRFDEDTTISKEKFHKYSNQEYHNEGRFSPEIQKSRILSSLDTNLKNFQDYLLEPFAKNDFDDEDKLFHDLLFSTFVECNKTVKNNIDLFYSPNDDLEIICFRVKMLVFLMGIHAFSYINKDFYNGLGEDTFSELISSIGLYIDSIMQESPYVEEFEEAEIDADDRQAMVVALCIMMSRPEYCSHKETHISSRKFFTDFLCKDFEFHEELAELIANDSKSIMNDIYKNLIINSYKLYATEVNEIRNTYQSRQSSLLSLSEYFKNANIHPSDTNRVFLLPNIPKTKLVNAIKARQSFLNNLPQKVFLLVDDTLFGGAAEGIIVSEKYICFKEFMEKSRDFIYRGSERNLKELFQVDKRKVYLGDDLCISFTILQPQTVNTIINSLNQYLTDIWMSEEIYND